MMIPETFFSVNEELRLFFISCLFGGIIGLVYDVFRTARLILPHNSLLVAVEDVIFIIGYGVFLSAFASAAARGQVRIYFVIGNILGFSLYIATAGKVIIGIMRKISASLNSLLSKIFRPLHSTFAFFRKKARGKFVGSSKVIVNSVKNVKKLLQKSAFMLYNKTENKKRKT